jgi:hypothetical protein
MRLVACANVQVLVSEPLLLRERGRITWASFLQCCVVKVVGLLVELLCSPVGCQVWCGVVWQESEGQSAVQPERGTNTWHTV